MRRFYGLLTLALVGYATVVAWPSGVQAQSSQQQQEAVRQLERRVNAIDAEKLGERMARIEAMLETAKTQGETTNKLLLGVFATLALMLAERAVRGGPSRRQSLAKVLPMPEAEE